MKVNEVVEFEIMNLTSKGEGICFLPDKKIVVITGVNDKDEVVKAKIKSVGLITIKAEKVSRVRSQDSKVESVEIEDSPYEIDDEDYDDEEFYDED